MLHEASPQTGSPHPSFHLKSFESTTCKQRARQNLGSKEFRNKIFGTKNLAVGALRKHAGLFSTYFQHSNSAPYFETGAVKIFTATKYLSG
jgi:hypothetical protein